ncbi:DUF4062 domain-containing protein [Sulfurimonas aquatica]|uniref:DUF4062 domain-containing protein n=1 Tax=Sulfurimonas aquatica TaxID=2672570 RepID=A0A975B0W1_9BACT|nr:AAA family ATPase [Sulfurimonas aquatica]QSZ42181.1 DUF4062 domain-containing protein [Sulfurimonas aquatica]
MTSSKTFRLFISSTFNDLQEERNILQGEVFPEIKAYCQSYGYSFEPIDLRWGVSSEAGLDHKAMQICINEVEKLVNYPKPNFLIMLGSRYGWIPAPTNIEALYFEKLLEVVEAHEKELLSKWYIKDENSIPQEYVLQAINSVLDETQDYVSTWSEVEKKIVSSILEHKHIFPSHLHIGKSATEQEIIKGVLNSAHIIQTSDDSVLCMVRNISNIGEVDDAVFLEDNREKLNDLKSRLQVCQEPKVEYCELNAKLVKKEEQFKPDKEYLEDYAIAVKRFLKEKIDNEIGQVSSQTEMLEDKIHEKFKSERAKVFIGREDILEKIQNYVESEEQSPFTIYGESGVGKSALMAKIIATMEETLGSTRVLYRFVGISELSSQPKQLIDNMIYTIESYMGDEKSVTPKDYSQSINLFIRTLNRFSELSSEKLVIVIDALDQFETKSSLEWIESQLPKNIKIILSTLPSEYGDYYGILKTKVSKKNIYKVEKLNVVETRAIVDEWLKINKKKLTQKQMEHLLALFEKNALPLYLKIIFDQALSWKSYDNDYKTLNDETLVEAIRTYFKELEVKHHHSKMLVEHTLGYLSASKNGLSEHELVSILSSDYIVMDDISNPYHKLISTSGVDKLPAAVWSRLYYDLLKYFTFVEFDGVSLISFYHRKIKECSRDYYYRTSKEFYHTNLLEYFWNQPLVHEKSSVLNFRKLSELPFHCLKSNSYSKFIELYQVDFMSKKVNAGQKENMLHELYEFVESLLNNEELNVEYKDELIEKVVHTLFSFFIEKVKDPTSQLISVEDLHATYVFKNNAKLYLKILEVLVAAKETQSEYNSNVIDSYMVAFKARKGNVLRREAKLKEANELYEEIIANDGIKKLHNLEQSTILYDVGTIAYLRGEPEKALKFLQESINAAGDGEVSRQMSLIKYGQVRFVYYRDYELFETTLGTAFEVFWKSRLENLSARRFVKNLYALYFDLYYAMEDVEKAKLYLEKFKNDETSVYKSICYIPQDKSVYESSGCTGFTPYEARINILEGNYEEAVDMFKRYIYDYMSDSDRVNIEFMAKEYFDYLKALKELNRMDEFHKECEIALKLPDEPLNEIWKREILKLKI